MKAREVYVERDGVTPAGARAAVLPHRREPDHAAPPKAGAHTREALTAWGIADVDALIESGAAVQA